MPSAAEIESLHRRKEGVLNRQYSDEFGNLYIGLSNGRIKLLKTVDEINTEKEVTQVQNDINESYEYSLKGLENFFEEDNNGDLMPKQGINDIPDLINAFEIDENGDLQPVINAKSDLYFQLINDELVLK